MSLSSSQPPSPQASSSSAQRAKRSPLFTMIVSLIGGGAVGLGFGYLLPRFVSLPKFSAAAAAGAPEWLNITVILCLAFVCIFLALAFHEWGHILGGQSAGFQFFLFIVGPLCIAREQNVLRARLNTDLSLAGGLAACIPPTGASNVREGMLRLILGGPLASALLGALAFGSLAALRASLAAAGIWGEWLVFALATLGATSLLIGVATGIK